MVNMNDWRTRFFIPFETDSSTVTAYLTTYTRLILSTIDRRSGIWTFSRHLAVKSDHAAVTQPRGNVKLVSINLFVPSCLIEMKHGAYSVDMRKEGRQILHKPLLLYNTMNRKTDN